MENTSNEYEAMSSPTPEDDIYEAVNPKQEPVEDQQGYLVPYLDGCERRHGSSKRTNKQTEPASSSKSTSKTGVISIYEDLWSYKNQNANGRQIENPLAKNDEQIYDEVETLIPSSMPGAKIIPIEEPASAYDEVIINDSRYIIPSQQWDSDSDALESDFDEDTDAPNYFGKNLEVLYENLENRKLVSPTPKTLSFNAEVDDELMVKPSGGLKTLGSCLPIPFTKTSKALEKSSEEDPLYVDPNNLGEKEPVMPPLSMELSAEEKARYEIVQTILTSEAAYKENLSQLVKIEQESRDRKLLEEENLDVIFCSFQSILQCHEMFSVELAARMNEWTVKGKIGDVICALFSKATTTMAYTDFVNNFLAAVDMHRVVCKNNSIFSQYVQATENNFKPKASFHDLMLKPFERCPEFIVLIQDLLELTPVSHIDRVPLQLAITQLECLAELLNSRRKESEMKTQLKYLDSQISQLNKPLSSSGRVFIRQDDMIHCLVDGVSVVGTKKLRLVLLSDMLLCLSPVAKKKMSLSGLLNTPKYKYKLKWNVPLCDVQFIEYGTGVSVAAGKYGTTTTYSEEGKYRQATRETQKHIEDLQHDLAVIGQIAGLVSSLRGKHQLLDHQKVKNWHKSVENTITEELKAINMFWLELSLPTKSGQHNYVFNLSSPTVKDEWQADVLNAKLALESRNNPGWYLPEEDVTGGLSILRRNMPLLAEFFDLFIFNARSTVEHTITYPMETSSLSSSMTARGLGDHVWISARGELQGHVSVLHFERNARVPRFVESFKVCAGTVYSIAHIPAMNSRSDQSVDRYHTKYGFPFPTVWLGSHSSRIYIYDAACDNRSGALMELKLRDAPLAMNSDERSTHRSSAIYSNNPFPPRFAMRKVYVGLANGTLAIFRSNTSGHWNLVQPSILPLGRYPVAVIADVKDNLWCSSGSQIYVVSKKGDRIQRIISVDPNMKNLVKHLVSCGVGVWVSVWRKATIKLYHAETYDMMQEVNIVSPILKMKNDVDSQVQYLSLDKLSVTALLFIPGFLWVGTSLGLILLYPLPKMQGVPRVIGRACVAFHAHCGPVRSLLAIPQGVVAEKSTSDDVNSADEDPNEINRKFTMLADSEESVASDEEFYFVDDKATSSRKQKVATSSSSSRRLKVSVKGTQQTLVNQQLPSSDNSQPFNVIKPDDFARMMETFDGFNQISSSKGKEKDDKNVRSFKNQLFVATHGNESSVCEKASLENGNATEGTSALPGKEKVEINPDDEKICVASTVIDPEDNIDGSVSTAACDDAKDVSNVPRKIWSTGEQNIVNEKDLQEENFPSGSDSQKGSTSAQTRETLNVQDQAEHIETTSSGGGFPSSTKVVDVSLSNEEIQNNSSPPKAQNQDIYLTVLPSTLEQSNTKQSESNTRSIEGENAPNSLTLTSKSHGKCLSYLVVSGGEGHVDLRLKVKSKQDLKKDGQSIFLIWRVNSKI